MIIEAHLLQNFAPSNLNRDDTGAPKECVFGGYRRARISSQSFKRAMRTAFRDLQLVDPAHLAERTKRASGEITQRLVAAGKPEAEAQRVVASLLASVKLDVAEDGKTRYLLFLAERELQAAAALCLRHWERFVELMQAADQSRGAGRKTAESGAHTGTRAGTTRAARQSGSDVLETGGQRAPSVPFAVPAEIRDAFLRLLDGGKAVDVALFGRMIADLPDHNIEAACQVAHALSTHRVSMEFDFFTAVDDLRPDDTAGADMLGTFEFNSACFYRYASLDTHQLARTLRDEDLTARAIAGFLQAFVTAEPTGKQNTMAAHNPPSFVMVVARDAGQWNLANAFLKPVAPGGGPRPGQGATTDTTDLMQESISALSRYWSRLTAMYGSPVSSAGQAARPGAVSPQGEPETRPVEPVEDGAARGIWVATTDPEALQALAPYQVASVQEVIAGVLGAAAGGSERPTARPQRDMGGRA